MPDPSHEMNACTHALVEASRSVLDAHDSKRVIRHILSSAQNLLHAQAASIFLLNRRKRRLEMAASTNLPPWSTRTIHFPVGKGVAGWVAQHNTSARVDNVAEDPRFYSGVDSKTGFVTRGYLCVPLTVRNRVIGTLQVLNRSQGGRFSQQDQELLEAFAVIAALAINKSRMQEIAIEKKRMETELEVAKVFQQRLLPDRFDPPEGFSIGGFNEPARQMGGDIYDGFTTRHGYTVLIGDVSGKGPGAAFWMSGLSNVIRFLIDRGHDPLNEIGEIDRHLTSQLPMEAFVTMFLGSFADNRLRYTSAGHNPMFLITPENDIELLESTGLPLGMMPDMPREVKEVPFLEGSRLVLFTDGVTEAENRNGAMFGEDRLKKVVLSQNGALPDQTIQHVLRSLNRFTSGTEQSDDITMLVVSR